MFKFDHKLFIVIKQYLNRSLYLHLRLPFSLFLLPVYLFALSQAPVIDLQNAILVFISLHLFIYPASNLYNSFMDRDEGPIGTLLKPPPVNESFFVISIVLDLIGLILLFLADSALLIPGIIYSGISRVYSWKGIRLKKYPVTGWFTVAFFQGGFTFYIVHSACTEIFAPAWITVHNLIATLLATLLIGACYPFTQIYQHVEDASRGDKSISLLLGIQGTFIFSGIVFLCGLTVAAFYFESRQFIIFLLCLLPVAVYYILWLYQCLKDRSSADYIRTMRMIAIASVCTGLCWIILTFINQPQIG